MNSTLAAMDLGTAPKSFDDAAQYRREIRLLAPGYDLLHTMLPSVIAAALPQRRTRVLIVGCGTAEEAVALARVIEGCRIDGLDPSPAMAEAARETVKASGLTERIQIHTCALADFTVTHPYDAVVALLVGHLVPDDGARQHFLGLVSEALLPGGVAILSEFEDTGLAHSFLTEAHLQCSQQLGVPAHRIGTLRERLTVGFHSLTRSRLRVLANNADLHLRIEFFRAFGVVGLLLDRKKPMPELPVFLANVLEPRFGRRARVSAITELAPTLRKVRFEGESLRGYAFQPGQEVEFRVSGRAFRHYSPAAFDPLRGSLDVIFHLHGTAPGTKWVDALTAEQPVNVLGPGGGFRLREVEHHVFLGDETTLGAFSCLANAASQAVSGAIEVASGCEAWPEAVGLKLPAVVRRSSRGSALLEWLRNAPITPNANTCFYLLGHAASISILRAELLQLGWSRSQILTRAYWADRKRGL